MNRLGQLSRMRSSTSQVIGAGCGAEPDETERFLFTLPPSEERVQTLVHWDVEESPSWPGA